MRSAAMNRAALPIMPPLFLIIMLLLSLSHSVTSELSLIRLLSPSPSQASALDLHGAGQIHVVLEFPEDVTKLLSVDSTSTSICVILRDAALPDRDPQTQCDVYSQARDRGSMKAPLPYFHDVLDLKYVSEEMAQRRGPESRPFIELNLFYEVRVSDVVTSFSDSVLLRFHFHRDDNHSATPTPPPPPSPSFVIDAFPFFNEAALLYLRLVELSPFVDVFILLESEVTHSGDKKPLHWRDVLQHDSLFAPFSGRIFSAFVSDNFVTERSLELSESDGVSPVDRGAGEVALFNRASFLRERVQRDAILDAVLELLRLNPWIARSADDLSNVLMLVGDSDEFVSRSGFQRVVSAVFAHKAREVNNSSSASTQQRPYPRVQLTLQWHMYSLSWVYGIPWGFIAKEGAFALLLSDVVTATTVVGGAGENNEEKLLFEPRGPQRPSLSNLRRFSRNIDYRAMAGGAGSLPLIVSKAGWHLSSFASYPEELLLKMRSTCCEPGSFNSSMYDDHNLLRLLAGDGVPFYLLGQQVLEGKGDALDLKRFDLFTKDSTPFLPLAVLACAAQQVKGAQQVKREDVNCSVVSPLLLGMSSPKIPTEGSSSSTEEEAEQARRNRYLLKQASIKVFADYGGSSSNDPAQVVDDYDARKLSKEILLEGRCEAEGGGVDVDWDYFSSVVRASNMPFPELSVKVREGLLARLQERCKVPDGNTPPFSVTLPVLIDEAKYRTVAVDGKYYVVMLLPGDDVDAVADEHCFGMRLGETHCEALKEDLRALQRQ